MATRPSPPVSSLFSRAACQAVHPPSNGAFGASKLGYTSTWGHAPEGGSSGPTPGALPRAACRHPRGQRLRDLAGKGLGRAGSGAVNASRSRNG
jgi:hypothetical protein